MASSRQIMMKTILLLTLVLSSTVSWGQIQIIADAIPQINANAGQSTPSSSTVTFTMRTNTGSVNYSIQSSVNWLSVSPASGSLTTASKTITVVANATFLAKKSTPYTTSLVVSGPGATTVSLPVTLTVNGVLLIPSPTSLPFTTTGSPTLSTLVTVSLENSIKQAVQATLDAPNASWITLVGSSSFTTPGTVQLRAAPPQGVSPGSYPATIHLTCVPGGGSPCYNAVDVTVTVPQPTITISGTTIPQINVRAGQFTPDSSSETFIIKTDTGTANYSIQPVYSGSPTGWLSVSPSSGTVTTSGQAIKVTADGSLLSRSTTPYTASLVISGGTTQTTLPVSVKTEGGLSAIPHLAAGGEWTTGILVVNTGSTPASFSIRFYRDNGQPVNLPFSKGSTNVLTDTVPAYGSAYYEASDPKLDTVGAWGSIFADSTLVVQASFRRNVKGTYYEAAVPSSTGSGRFTVPFDATTFAAKALPFFTGFAVANLDTSLIANVACTVRDSDGTVIPFAITIPTLSPQGHWADYNFPALVGKRGTIVCTSNTTVAVTVLRFIGSDALSTLPVIDPAAITRNALPGAKAVSHLAAGGEWTTGILAVNTSTSPTTFTINFYGDKGEKVKLPFSTGLADQFSRTVPALGSVYVEASNPDLLAVGAWGLITGDPAIVVQALFRRNVREVYYEAAVSSNAGSTQFTIPFDATTFSATGALFYTGFGVANLDSTRQAAISCLARDSNGIQIPNAITVPSIAPLGHWAEYLFPALTGKRGTLSCTSNTTVSATVLRFIGADALSTLPIIGQ